MRELSDSDKEWILAAYGEEAGGALLEALPQVKSHEEFLEAIRKASEGDRRIEKRDPEESRIRTPFLTPTKKDERG